MKRREKKPIEKDFITKRFGRSPRIKILEFLINNKEESWGIREIIKYAGVKHRNLLIELKDLVVKDLVYIEKTLGKSHLYRINEFEPYIQSLVFAMELRK